MASRQTKGEMIRSNLGDNKESGAKLPRSQENG